MSKLIQLTLGASLLVALLLGGSEQKTSSPNFVHVYNRCYRLQNFPAAYEPLFNNFTYPDEPQVHRFMHCLWSDMGFWSDRKGFNAEAIAHYYGNKANVEILVPTLSVCNEREQDPTSPMKWCYAAFQCVLNSRVGQWYRNDVSSMIERRNG